MKTIKYWRFAAYGHSHETECQIPDNLKLFCLNPDTNIINSHGYANLSYFGMISYTEDIWNRYKENTLWNCTIQNINNTYITFYFDQVYPLDNSFPITDIFPNIEGPEYIKIRAKKVSEYTDEYKAVYNEVMSEIQNDNKNTELVINKLFPITNYVKIHKLIHKGSLVYYDITDIRVFSVIYDFRPVYNIKRTEVECTDMDDNYSVKVECSNKTEFDNAFSDVINNL